MLPSDELAGQHGVPGSDDHTEQLRVDPATRYALARAVSARSSRAAVLDTANRITERTSIEAAVEQDRCFFVEVSDEVLAVDFDSVDAVFRANRLAAVLLVSGYLPVIVASGRAGHRHVFARLPQGARPRIVELAELTGQEVRRTIRPPLAAHRHGEPVRLVMPADPAEALARLTGDRPARPLGEKAQRALHAGTRPRGRSVSEVVFSLAMGAANAGWTLEDFELVLTTPTFGIHEVYSERARARGELATLQWAHQQVWPKAVAEVQANPAHHQGPSTRTIALVTWALTSPWPGRTGATDRAVYLAMLHKQVRCGVTPFDASQRELCVLAGISSRATVDRALRRLVERRLVRRHPHHRPDERPGPRVSDAWELVDPDVPQMPMADPRCLIALDVLAEDLFRNRVGLGKAAQHLFALIACWPGSGITQLAALTHRGHRWLHQQLRTMEQLGLVRHEPDRGWIPGEVLTDVAAKEIGAAGRADRQRTLFELERDVFDRPVDRWARGAEGHVSADDPASDAAPTAEVGPYPWGVVYGDVAQVRSHDPPHPAPPQP